MKNIKPFLLTAWRWYIRPQKISEGWRYNFEIFYCRVAVLLGFAAFMLVAAAAFIICHRIADWFFSLLAGT